MGRGYRHVWLGANLCQNVAPDRYDSRSGRADRSGSDCRSYSDPNFVIASTIGGVIIDNAAYNARYGDHSINLAVTYDVKEWLVPFAGATTDGRDGSFTAGWSPRDTMKHEWLAVEGLWGNGFLRRAEERQQYKVSEGRTKFSATVLQSSQA